MGRVKEVMYDRIEEAARMAGEDEWLIRQDFNRRFTEQTRDPRKHLSVNEYIANLAKK